MMVSAPLHPTPSAAAPIGGVIFYLFVIIIIIMFLLFGDSRSVSVC